MTPTKAQDIGMKRGTLLCNLPPQKQLDLIAEGLPLLMKSAEQLLDASDALGEHVRAKSILHGHAMEEAAKVLILFDIVRCPKRLRASRAGLMMKWFYDHLARLLYVQAQSWKPMHAAQLQEYLDLERASHSLEGAMGEYIMPNWTLWSREGRLYADIVAYEDGEPQWSEPTEAVAPLQRAFNGAWQVCVSLQRVGAFTSAGLKIASEIWDAVNFEGETSWAEARTLTHTMLVALNDAGLVSEDATDDDVRTLYHNWQVPMYHLDFRRLDVDLETLKAAQDAALWAEIGV
jgi:hypothetical protein